MDNIPFYTAEELREALCFLWNDAKESELKKIFGDGCKTVYSIVSGFSGDEIADKVRNYRNAPKVGEYWKRKCISRIAIILNNVNGTVKFMYVNKQTQALVTEVWSKDEFITYYERTGDKEDSLQSIIDKLNE